jgi:hypothetical protein
MADARQWYKANSNILFRIKQLTPKTGPFWAKIRSQLMVRTHRMAGLTSFLNLPLLARPSLFGD